MSLLDSPIDVISMDEAEDRAFDADLCKVEMDDENPDAFRPSHNLIQGFGDEIGGLHLDNSAFDSFGLYEYGPFSPQGSPRNEKMPALEKIKGSFTNANFKESNLPPKYFKTVESSPQKRRVLSRPLNRCKSFSFEAFEAPIEEKVKPIIPTPTKMIMPKPIIQSQILIKKEPESEPSKLAFKTPTRVARQLQMTPKPSPIFTTPENRTSMATNSTAPGFSPLEKLARNTTSNVGVAVLDLNSWSMNNSVTLPPRYLQGPDASPEKKRIHSITFGKTTSFSFSASKSPKTGGSTARNAHHAGLRRSQSSLN